MVKEPLRRCAACRKQAKKYELFRIVKTENGLLELDEGYNKEGRGAYLHKDMSCVLKANLAGFWGRSFKKGEMKLDKRLISELIDGLIKRIS